MRKVSGAEVVATVEAPESALPQEIQKALGELVGAARLARAECGVGLGVVHELMELEVTEVVGPKGKHDRERTAKRHGHEDEFDDAVRASGKSSVSEMFVERTRTALEELMGRRLEDVRLAALMLDGLEIAERTHVVALGITTEGVKIPLGLREGSTENATLATTLLSDLVDRDLDPAQAILFVIDGFRALRKAIKDVFSYIAATATRRGTSLTCCPNASARRSAAGCAQRGRSPTPSSPNSGSSCSLQSSTAPGPTPAARCARGWTTRSPSCGSGSAGQLAKTLVSTNPCESMIEIVRHTQRNVKCWRDGDMRKRWTAAGMLAAEQQFRRIIG